MSKLAYSRLVAGSVTEAAERLGAELRGRGFGVLASFPIHEILREKVGAEIEPLVILEVCSPRDAQRALAVSREASLLLPCKIVVGRESGATRVSLQRPTVAVRSLMPGEALERLSEDVERSLRESVDAVADAPST